MDYKEKYENGLECIQEILSGAGDLIRISTLRKRLQPFFPELAESEDERVRKAILELVRQSSEILDKQNQNNMIAWLEKHGQVKESHISQHESETCEENNKFLTNEDERIKETLKGFVKGYSAFINGQWRLGDFTVNRLIDWLEKHDEQKETPCDKCKKEQPSHSCQDITELGRCALEKQNEQKHGVKIKPKFHEDDWIIFNGLILHIDEVVNGYYRTTSRCDGIHNSYDWDIDNAARLWTIQEAKDGDVLTTDNFIFIFKSIDNSNGVHYYCHYEISKREDDGSRFGIALPQSLMGIVGSSFTHYKPATKEQRDLLFQKMKEEGYEWDDKKKEVKKIEPEFDGDDILLSLSLGNNQVQDILEDMGMLDDNGQCPHTAEEIFKAGMEHAFNLNREAASSVKVK